MSQALPGDGRRRPPVDEKKLVKLYVEDELTQRQVATRLGVGVDFVGEVLRKNGVTAKYGKRMPW